MIIAWQSCQFWQIQLQVSDRCTVNHLAPTSRVVKIKKKHLTVLFVGNWRQVCATLLRGWSTKWRHLRQSLQRRRPLADGPRRGLVEVVCTTSATSATRTRATRTSTAATTACSSWRCSTTDCRPSTTTCSAPSPIGRPTTRTKYWTHSVGSSSRTRLVYFLLSLIYHRHHHHHHHQQWSSW